MLPRIPPVRQLLPFRHVPRVGPCPISLGVAFSVGGRPSIVRQRLFSSVPPGRFSSSRPGSLLRRCLSPALPNSFLASVSSLLGVARLPGMGQQQSSAPTRTHSSYTSRRQAAEQQLREMADIKFEVEKSEAEWKAILDDFEYAVLRQKDTERAGTGEYNKFKPKSGYFACKGCQNPLYSWSAKFDSGCGWPAYDKCFKGAVLHVPDLSHGMVRNEIVCAKCGGHLGHVFEGERFTATNERHCVNSVSVVYVAEEPAEGLGEEEALLAAGRKAVHEDKEE